MCRRHERVSPRLLNGEYVEICHSRISQKCRHDCVFRFAYIILQYVQLLSFRHRFIAVSVSICISLPSVLASSASSALLEGTAALCGRWLAVDGSFSLSPPGAALFCPLPCVELGRLVLDLLSGTRSGPRWSIVVTVVGVG